MQATLIDRFLAGVRINPAAPAMIAGGRVITHQQVLSLVGATARRLYQEGLRPGGTVGVSMEQGPLHCVAVLALARLGVVSVPIAPGMAPAVRDRLLRGYAIDTLVSSWPAAPGATFRVITLDKLTAVDADADLDFLDFRPQPDTPLRIVLSSGTTKDPRGVLHSHGDWVLRTDRTLVDCDKTSRLIPPDLHITLGMVFTLGVLCVGGTVVFPRSNDRDGLLLAINRCAVSHLIISPASMLPILTLLPQHGMLLPTLRHLRLVGTTPTAALLEKIRTRCTPNVCVPYGLTELGPISMASGAGLERQPDSAGPVYPWARVEIVDANGQPVADNASGEIRVAVDGMPGGYHRVDDDADGKFRDGWFYPGDRGRVKDGLLFVEGRIDDIINIGGYKISPEKIEATLAEHPAVVDAAVHMAPRAGGEAILAAAVVPVPGVPLGELAAYARRRLGVVAPQSYRTVDKLPRNAMGKLQRDRLAELTGSPVREH